MTDDIACVIRAAGAGTRLDPVTRYLPKPLCPVGQKALVDWSLDAVRQVVEDVAVTVRHHRDLMLQHLAQSNVYISDQVERDIGAIGQLNQLRPWIDGRDVLLVSADSWFRESLRSFIQTWDRRKPRLWVVDRTPDAGDFGSLYYVGVCLLPSSYLLSLPLTKDDLFAPKLLEEW